MWKKQTIGDPLGGVALTRESLEKYAAQRQRSNAIKLSLNAALLFFVGAIIATISLLGILHYFYMQPLMNSQKTWVHLRNLTPVITIKTHVSGPLEKLFVSDGQLVRKGEVLGVIATQDLRSENKRLEQQFADHVIELHCLTSLKLKRTKFELPFDAALLVSNVIDEDRLLTRKRQCEDELVRNAKIDQYTIETIASLEDQVRLFESLANINDTLGSLGQNQDVETSKTNQIDSIAPLIKLAETDEKLRVARKDYLQTAVQNNKDLSQSIKQISDEIRQTNKRLLEVQEALKNNFVYAAQTGVVVSGKLPEIGLQFTKGDTLFELHPVDNKFLVSIPLKDRQVGRFQKGDRTTLKLGVTEQHSGILIGETKEILRTPSGGLEAVIGLQGDAKYNADQIRAAGYTGQGEQRFSATVTTGQETVLQSLQQIFGAYSS